MHSRAGVRESRAQSRSGLRCPTCSGPGRPLHAGLRDRVGHAPGEWTLAGCSDPDCGLAWLEPAPDQAVLETAYGSYYTHHDTGPVGSIRRLNGALVTAHLERRYGYETGLNRWSAILALLAIGHPGGAAELGFRVMYLQRPQPSAQLLDVGCGSGQFLDRMRSLGWTVRGLDTDPAAVEVATSRGLDVRLGQLGPKTYGDSTFDAVCLSHSIEHLADPGAVLSECRRVLKPDGVLVVATPNLDSWGHRLFGASWIHLDPPRHQHLFRKASLLRLMRDRGLRVDAAFTTSRTARFVWSASRAVARSGRAVLGGPRARRELAGFPFQLLQRLLLAFRPTAGEELIVLARRG